MTEERRAAAAAAAVAVPAAARDPKVVIDGDLEITVVAAPSFTRDNGSSRSQRADHAISVLPVLIVVAVTRDKLRFSCGALGVGGEGEKFSDTRQDEIRGCLCSLFDYR